MRNHWIVAPALAGLLLASGAGAADLGAQETTPPRQERAEGRHGPHGPGGRHGGMVERLIERRAELGLTDAQVSRLEAIRADLQQRNEPLRERMRQAMGGARPERGQRRQMTEEQRAEMRRRMEAARPVVQEMRANQRAAMERVREVLTAEQQAQLRERMEARRGEHRGHRGEGRHGERRRPQPADG